MKTLILATIAIAIPCLSPAPSFAQEKSLEQQQFEQNMQQADEAYRRLQQDQQREQMRDRSHDFPRVKVDENVSVGGGFNPPEVNIRITN